VEAARRKILKGQAPFLDQLLAKEKDELSFP
jgi:predicted NUDIX family NTP pyrophosphohydrolase